MNEVFRAITGQIDYHWRAGIWPRIVDLTDGEYLWEPVPGCWTLHRTENGMVSYDFEWPSPQPPPLTTIAWRLFHIAVGCFAERTTRYFPEQAGRPWTQRIWEGPFEFPMGAAEALAFLDMSWREWRSGLEAGGENAMWQPLGDAEGDIREMQLGSDDPFIGLVLHVHREVIHHGAEILLLRDLYRSMRVD
ncbi:MAG: DinB family protein [Pseudonocardiaceae bacterium]